jgi:hypothetical protein
MAQQNSEIIAWIACAQRIQGADAPNSGKPILVELFTSEGCSSCPPADTWPQKLDSTQPIAGARLIVLSEHVDYWNHDSWKDPFSSPKMTNRQSAYVRALGLVGRYTPQVIANAKSELKLSDTQQTAQVLSDAVRAMQVPVKIGSLTIQGTAPAILRARIELDGTSAKHDAGIYAAGAMDHAESQVLRGGNDGRRLTHLAVVEQLVKIGKLEKGKIFDQDLIIKLKPGMDPKNLRLVVFAQEPELGSVLGAGIG